MISPVLCLDCDRAGMNGEQSIPQEAIRNHLRKLVNVGKSTFLPHSKDTNLAGDPPFKLHVAYESKQGSGLLFQRELVPSKVLNSIRNTFNLTQTIDSM